MISSPWASGSFWTRSCSSGSSSYRSRGRSPAVQPIGGLGGDHADPAIVSLEESTDPHQGAGCPQPGHEMGDLAVGLIDDLGAGRIEVRTPVEWIVVLVRHEIDPGCCLLHAMGFSDGSI